MKKIKAIYIVLEGEIMEKRAIWSEAFTAEMERRSNEMLSGKVKGKSRSSVSQKARAILKGLVSGLSGKSLRQSSSSARTQFSVGWE